jgi:hypothetical protein
MHGRAASFRWVLPCGVALLLFVGCTNPYTPADAGTSVYVVGDYFHSAIVVQRPAGAGTFDYTIYSFGDRAWYLEQSADVGTAIAAALLPTDGILRIGHATTTDPPQDILGGLGFVGTPEGWQFTLSETDLSAALAWVTNEFRASAETVSSRTLGIFSADYYTATTSYHTFYSCLQFVAEFLNRSGVDFSPVWYFYTNELLRERLDVHTERVF